MPTLNHKKLRDEMENVISNEKKYRNSIRSNAYAMDKEQIQKYEKQTKDSYKKSVLALKTYITDTKINANLDEPYNGSLTFDAFAKYMESIDMTYKSIQNKDNNLLKAIFILLKEDKSGFIADTVLKSEKCVSHIDTLRIFKPVLIAFEGKEDTLKGEAKKSFEFIKHLHELTEDTIKKYSEAQVALTAHTKLKEKEQLDDDIENFIVNPKKNKETRKPTPTKNDNYIPPITNTNNNIIYDDNLKNNNDSFLFYDDYSSNYIFGNYFYGNNNFINNRYNNYKIPDHINAIMEQEKTERKTISANMKNYKDGDPLEIKVYYSDFVELIKGLDRSQHLSPIFDMESVLDYVQNLQTNEEKMEYFNSILNFDNHARYWEYSNPPVLEENIRNCGNLTELKKYYLSNQDKLDIKQRILILKRIHVIEKAKKYSENEELPDFTNYNKGEDSVSLNISFDKPQSSSNGCWSCSLMMMLKAHGINVDQEDIRAYRPDLNMEDRKDKTVLLTYDRDKGMNVSEAADSALAFAPNRMMRYFSFALPSKAQQHLGTEQKIDWKKYVSACAEEAAKRIKQILNEEKTPITFTNGAHYYTIKSINGKTVKCIDSVSNEFETDYKLEDLIDNLFKGSFSDHGPMEARFCWMSKIELDAKDNSLLNVPSHYVKVNPDGTLTQPPLPEQEDADTDKAKFEQAGFRVRMVGGLDDTEYDRMKRNPLDKNNVLISEGAYLPKKVNLAVLKRRAEKRPKADTKLLRIRRDEKLGKNFVPPKRPKGLTTKAMRESVDANQKLRTLNDVLIEFKTSCGMYNQAPKKVNGKYELWDMPGAVVAFRIHKAFSAFEKLASYMIEQGDDENKFWDKSLREIKTHYNALIGKLSGKENAIKDEITPDIYPYKGYFKQSKDISEAIRFLYQIGDKIDLGKHFNSKMSLVNNKDYNPTVLARFAENIKIFAYSDMKGNVLRNAAKFPKTNEAINIALTMPSTDPKVLNQNYYNGDGIIRNYINFSHDAMNGIYNSISYEVENAVNSFVNVIIKDEKAVLPFIKSIYADVPKKLLREPEIPIINEINNKNNNKNDNKNDNKNNEKPLDNKINENKEDDNKINDKKPDFFARADKRNKQYKEFLKKFSGVQMDLEDIKSFRELGSLLDYMAPYLELNSKKTMSYNELKETTDKYSSIIRKMDEAQNSVFSKNPAYAKFRIVMSKDLRTLYDVLKADEKLTPEEKAKKSYHLGEIFEQARSITVEVDEKNIERKGGNLSSRLHIKANDFDNKPIDGYFTIHEKPFDAEERLNELADSVVGNDDFVLHEFIKYLIRDEGNNSSNIKTLQRKIDRNCSIKKIHLYYSSPDKLLKAFSSAFDRDIKKFISSYGIDSKNPSYSKIIDLKNRFMKDPDSVEELLGLLHSSFLIRMKEKINDLGINNNAKVDKRNSAMSMVAGMLGLDNLIAKSRNMRVKIGNETYKGTFMETAKGVTMNSVKPDSPELFITNEQLENNPQLLISIANMQILDLICGNTDRHGGNYSYIIEDVVLPNGEVTKKLVGIQGLDNDTSFLAKYDNIQWETMASTAFDKMLVLPESTAQMILHLDKNIFRAMAIGHDISKDAIDAAIIRIEAIQNKIQEFYNDYENRSKAPIKEGQIKIIKDEDFANLSIKDLARPKAPGDDRYFNLFSRVYDRFAIQNDQDPIDRDFENSIRLDAKEAQYKVAAANIMLTNSFDDINNAKEQYQSNIEFNDMIMSIIELQNIYNKSKKDTFRYDPDSGEIIFNEDATQLLDNSKEAYNKTKHYIELNEEALSKLSKESKEYESLRKNIDRVIKCQTQLERFVKGYESINKSIEDFKTLQNTINTRKKIYEDDLKKKDETRKTDELDNLNINFELNNNKNITNNKHDSETEINTDTNPKGKKKLTSDALLGKGFVEEVDNLENCIIAFRDELKSIRETLKTAGRKNANAKDYRQDGHSDYRNMAASLDDCIDALENGNFDKSLNDMIKKIGTLEEKSYAYHDSHFGLFGFKFHDYGEVRLRESFNLGEKAATMFTTLKRIKKNINRYDEAKKIGNESLNNLKNNADITSKKYNLVKEDLKYRGYQYEKSVSMAQLKGFSIVREYDPYHVSKYSNIGSINKYMNEVNNNKELSYYEKAKVAIMGGYMKKLLKLDISPKEAESIYDEFQKVAIPVKARELGRKMYEKESKEASNKQLKDAKNIKKPIV
ncbi:MAG: hypothetical protein K6F60_02305 [Eubacterium sp.]|nr:hypothetical protein [Eubacterium sp.]